MFVFACCVFPIFFATRVEPWTAVVLIGIAGAAHQAWSANLFTTTSDMFPKRAVASLVGMGGMAGSLGGILFPLFAGVLLDRLGTSRIRRAFRICGSAYLVAFVAQPPAGAASLSRSRSPRDTNVRRWAAALCAYSSALSSSPLVAALVCAAGCLSTEGYYRYQDAGATGAADAGTGYRGTGVTGGGGTTGSAGTGGAAGAAGTTGTAGTARRGGAARRGRPGAAAAGQGGTTGSAGRGGTTGAAGVTATAAIARACCSRTTSRRA